MLENTRHRGTGIAALALLLALTGCTAGEGSGEPTAPTRDDSGEITEAGTSEIDTLAVGDCLDDAALAGQSDAPTAVGAVPTVPCADPHDFEVLQNLAATEAEAYPGQEAIFAQADAGCLAAFDPYVGLAYQQSALNYTFYYPTEQTWAEGDRAITCLLTEPGVKTTGSLAGVAR